MWYEPSCQRTRPLALWTPVPHISEQDTTSQLVHLVTHKRLFFTETGMSQLDWCRSYQHGPQNQECHIHGMQCANSSAKVLLLQNLHIRQHIEHVAPQSEIMPSLLLNCIKFTTSHMTESDQIIMPAIFGVDSEQSSKS